VRVDTGTYRVVYFAFGFEAINSSAERAEIMRRVLSELTGPETTSVPEYGMDGNNLSSEEPSPLRRRGGPKDGMGEVFDMDLAFKEMSQEFKELGEVNQVFEGSIFEFGDMGSRLGGEKGYV
jgi:hypothetical protein